MHHHSHPIFLEMFIIISNIFKERILEKFSLLRKFLIFRLAGHLRTTKLIETHFGVHFFYSDLPNYCFSLLLGVLGVIFDDFF
jgi:hypothetical protein